MRFLQCAIYLLFIYLKCFQPAMGEISKAFKKNKDGTDWTQLQIICEATDDHENFPLGVRTTYRKFSSDEVYLIVNKNTVQWEGGVAPESPLDLIPMRCYVTTKPKAEDNQNGRPAGLFVLERLPRGSLLPAVFEPGIPQKLRNVVAWANIFWGSNDLLRDFVDDWTDFQKLFPQTDSVEEYLSRPDCKYEVPLAEMFHPEPGMIADLVCNYFSDKLSQDPIRRNLADSDGMLEGEFTASIHWRHGCNSDDRPPVRYINLARHGVASENPVVNPSHSIATLDYRYKPREKWTVKDYETVLQEKGVRPAPGVRWRVKADLIAAYDTHMASLGEQAQVHVPLQPPRSSRTANQPQPVERAAAV
jgi:hypothetical protein